MLFSDSPVQAVAYPTTREYPPLSEYHIVNSTTPPFSGLNHGTFLHIAHEEGLILNSSIHAGIRAPLVRPKADMRNDMRCGFTTISARDIDTAGIPAVIEKIKGRVAGTKVYISVDIDVLDPAFAPGAFPPPPFLVRLKSFNIVLTSFSNSH